MVWKDADVKWAAEAITEAFYGSGQICMVPNYVLVHPDVAEALIAEVKEQVKGIRPGLPDCSVVRPTLDENAGAVATINSFIADRLFAGQSKQFLTTIMQLAREADAAQRHATRR